MVAFSELLFSEFLSHFRPFVGHSRETFPLECVGGPHANALLIREDHGRRTREQILSSQAWVFKSSTFIYMILHAWLMAIISYIILQCTPSQRSGRISVDLDMMQ